MPPCHRYRHVVHGKAWLSQDVFNTLGAVLDEIERHPFLEYWLGEVGNRTA